MTRRSVTERAQIRIQKCLNTTLKFDNDELNLLISTIVIIDSFFTFQTLDYRPHISSITGYKLKSDTRVNEKYRRCLELANLHNGITDISFDLWSGLGEAIRNLMIGNYGSIYKSLRWIIETMAFWADMEKDNENAIARFKYYFEEESPMTKNRFSYLEKHIFDTLVFEEELKSRQKDVKMKKAYSFGDMVKYGHSSNSKMVNKILDTIVKDYNRLYNEFSSLIHVSLDSLKEIEKQNFEDYLFFLYYSYDKTKFCSRLETIWKVVDLMACTFIIYCTNFYSYNRPKSYMTSLLAHQRSRPDAKQLLNTITFPKVKAKLPLLFSLIGEIKQHITISATKFSPSRITLEAGDIVMWINNTKKSHTVTSGAGTNDPNRGKYFDSYKDMNRKPIGKRKIFLHTFTDTGKYDYFCQFHQEEVGTIIVRNN